MEPSKQPNTFLLVGRPGHVRDALAGLLGSLPEIGCLVCAESGLLALKAAREEPPILVLITSSLPDPEVPELVRELKLQYPGGPAWCSPKN